MKHIRDEGGQAGAQTGTRELTTAVLGRRTSLTDPTGNVTSWAYDGLSRVTSETNELSEVRTFEYNAASQLTKRTDRRGLAREFTYDPLGRMTSEVWKNGGSTVRTISFAYNAGSALTSASDADSSYAYTYDNLGRVTNVDNNGTSGVPRVQLASAYDANSNRTSLSATITSTLDLLNSYTYDGLNRLTRLDQTGQTGGNSVAEKRVDFSYNARSQFSSIARYKDTDGGSTHEVATSTFAYDNIGRLTALDHKHSTTDLANYDWTYDAGSRVTEFAYSHLVGGSGTSEYDYDATNQLVGADHSGLTDESYSFDESGNRTGGGNSTGDNNHLLSDGTFDYTYDEEGNRLTRERISSSPADDKLVEYAWDHRNRLVSVTNKDETDAVTQVVEYLYDLYDRKIGRFVDSDGDSDWDSIERYIYDGDDVVLEFLDADGDGAGDQVLSKRYLWGEAVDQLLAQEDVLKSLTADDRVLWPLVDNLGSVRDLADQTGDIVAHIEYETFCKPARILDGSGTPIALSALPTRYLYTTREYDSLTDLQYNRARWYDPRTGKWLSLDPIGFAAGDTTLDRYIANDPTNATDPSGLEKGHDGTRLEEGEAIPEGGIDSRGPRHLPEYLPGKWRVTIGVCGGHAWIRFENVDTGELVTFGRYENDYGGRVDDQGRLIVESVAESGVQMNRDLIKEDGLRSGMHTRRDGPVLENPRVFGRENAEGWNWWNNNCATYARDAWYYYTGEWFWLPLNDHPDELRRRVDNANNPPPDPWQFTPHSGAPVGIYRR